MVRLFLSNDIILVNGHVASWLLSDCSYSSVHLRLDLVSVHSAENATKTLQTTMPASCHFEITVSCLILPPDFWVEKNPEERKEEEDGEANPKSRGWSDLGFYTLEKNSQFWLQSI